MILHTEQVGSGEPIVFLHTGLQAGTTDFEYQREYFKSSFQIILPDLRGHGKSINNNLSNFFEDSAVDLSHTLDAEGVESAHIVGASLGALVGLFFAKRFPEKVKSLTLSGITPEKPEDWLEMHKQEVRFQTELLENNEAIAYFDQLHLSDWKHLLDVVRNSEWYPFGETKDLTDIKSPILLIVGEGNPNETKGAITYPLMQDNVHVSIIPFASHLVHSEQPKLYSEILNLFLRQIMESD
ncbi:alpha/beta fold hydrolase [Planococcus donghaensis]|uniref:Alpha/beta hydrolase n=1 Tax=Planococcus donghaensis TaxID=414778 RepID=A0A1C7EF72_9BACL|nr:alpha/beta hydrolase [Planococcus donghaensis]ANU22032.1 alpha/beta hydrolase [Planococcus donghaensis]